jgi:hypothetical protein
MEVMICAGPLCAGLVPPEVDVIESFVRSARPGEAATKGRCPMCSGTGVRTFRRGFLRCQSLCPSCHGSGIATGVPLVRAVGEERSPNVTTLLAWAREHRVRTDIQMLLRDEARAGWALAWVGLDGRPLRRWRDRLIAREALAVFVDHDDIHVALHAARDDGHIAVVGLWDVRLDDGALVRRWSERSSRSLAWRRRIGFPADVVHQALRVAQGLRGARASGHDRPCLDRRQPAVAATPALPGQTAAG